MMIGQIQNVVLFLGISLIVSCTLEEPSLPKVKELFSKSKKLGEIQSILVTNSAELNNAINQAVPGDIIVMKNGTWSDLNIVFRGIGIAENPIVLKAQSGGNVIISGNSSLKISGEYLMVNGLYFKDGASSATTLIEFRTSGQIANNCRITNLAVSGFNKPNNTPEFWVALYGSNNRVDHCLFQGKTTPGPLMTISRVGEVEDHHRIDYNYFRNIPTLGVNGAEAIRVGTSENSLSDSYTSIDYNLFENCDGEGELISIKSGRNKIRRNTIVKSKGSITLRQGDNNLVQGNFIFGGLVSNTGGIRITGENQSIRNNYIQGLRGASAISLIEGQEVSFGTAYYQVKNALIKNNTLIDNDKHIVIGERYNPTTAQDLKIMDSSIGENVILGTIATTQFIHTLDIPLNTLYYGNIVYGQGILASGLGLGIIYQDPQLIMGGDGVYYYPENSLYKDNIIGQPLKRDEVGPRWLLTHWVELGIVDTPYI